MNTIKATILDRVKKNSITMIPRWKFVLYSGLGIFGFIFIFLIMVFTFSLIIFLLSQYGILYMRFPDLMGSLRALSMLPIILFVCAAILLFIIEILSRNYTLSFRRPLIVTLLGFTSFTLLVGFFVSESGTHEYMRMYARDHHMGNVMKLYDRPTKFNPKHRPDVVRGEVLALASTSLTVKLFNDQVVTVVLPNKNNASSTPLRVGDDVIVFGKMNAGMFEMTSMRIAPPASFGRHMRMNTSTMRDDAPMRRVNVQPIVK